MEYVIADIRISLPEELIPRRFAEALRPFAVAEPIGRARAAGPEVAPREDAGRARSASPEVAPREDTGRARAAGPEVAPRKDAGRARSASPEVAPREDTGRARAAGPEVAPRECKGVMPELIPGAVTRIHPAPGWQELHRFEFPDAGADCRFGRDDAGFLLEMVPRDGTPAARFRTSETGDRTSCDFSIHHHPALFRFGVWMLFNLAALRRNAIAIHASAIRYRDAGLLFLGESGTGKSTHSRLWCRHIPGTSLLNDDSPILGLTEGAVRVWGSPWSGKVPCYRNESAPVAAIVRLVQAPENRIRRLAPVEALGALLPSAPPAFIRDTELRENICEALAQVIGQVPVFRLECRPDADAARLVCDTVFGRQPPGEHPQPTATPAHTPQP